MGVCASCVVVECIKCAGDAGPRRDTHGVFICDGKELIQCLESIWIWKYRFAKHYFRYFRSNLHVASLIPLSSTS